MNDIEISDEENSNEENSDEENSNEEKSDKGNSNEENSNEENQKNYSYSKVVFKACKKIDKTYFEIFFLYIKMTNNYYQKKQRRALKKGS